jgi:hypothetical protein
LSRSSGDSALGAPIFIIESFGAEARRRRAILPPTCPKENVSLPKISRRGFARAAAFAAIVLAAGAKAITPGAVEELKTVKIFYPPLDFGWTSGYELIEVANAQGYFKKHGLDAQLAVVPWDQYT